MKFVRMLVVGVLALPCVLFGYIVESMEFSDILRHLDASTLIVLDVDNTLIEPIQELGTDQWFYRRIEQYRNEGLEWRPATKKALSEWMAIQSITKVREVEPGTAKLIRRLQDEGYTVMGCTTRGLGLSTRTIEQLKSVGIDLTITAPTKDEVFLINTRGILYRGGIIFTAGSHKGHAFYKFLDKIRYKPKNVVFIDDKVKHVIQLEEESMKRGIPYVGLRYGYLDEKVRNFDKELTDLQFEHFGHILSDEQAHKLLQREG